MVWSGIFVSNKNRHVFKYTYYIYSSYLGIQVIECTKTSRKSKFLFSFLSPRHVFTDTFYIHSCNLCIQIIECRESILLTIVSSIQFPVSPLQACRLFFHHKHSVIDKKLFPRISLLNLLHYSVLANGGRTLSISIILSCEQFMYWTNVENFMYYCSLDAGLLAELLGLIFGHCLRFWTLLHFIGNL